MLKRLYIKNFALVKELDIEFHPGMNVITGETGAGKSVIIGALAQVLGERADKDDIRSGENMGIAEAEFKIGDYSSISNDMKNIDLKLDDNCLIVRKEIFSDNRSSRIFVNDQQITVKILKNITDRLAQLYGQHSHQLLLDDKNHREFLDSFAGITREVSILKDCFHLWEREQNELKALIKRKDKISRDRDLMIFQKEEIEKTQIRAGEEDELISEKKILDSAAVLGQKCSAILEILENDDHSILSALSICSKEMAHILNLDSKLEQNNRLLNDAYVNIEELRSGIESYASSIPDDPTRLDEINMRLDEIYRLKKKYGGSENSILETLYSVNKALENILNIDGEITDQKNRVERSLSDYITKAVKASLKRSKAAPRLTKLIKNELKDLGIDSAGFECEFIYDKDENGIEYDGRFLKPYPWGIEDIRIMFSANPGEPLKPLSHTASGGEISRVMLALKSSEQKINKKDQPLLVFDEIDSGIGGQTAKAVGEKLKKLGQRDQLIVITHLHQIAVLGDNHYAVTKAKSSSKDTRNVISVTLLDKKSRKNEIDRMISLPEKALF